MDPFGDHYSRTCLKRQKAAGVEWLSSSERVHPSFKSGGRLFQRGERQAIGDPKIVPEVVPMSPAPGSPTAGVLTSLGGTTSGKAPCWSHKAKSRQRSQPVKPRRRIGD
jgi:hypothetical protein